METIKVNGKEVSVEEKDLDTSLLDFIRYTLKLTGTKNGCNIGVCGACTVLVDGAPKRSCKVKVGSIAGKDVLTIEGMEQPDGSLHPIQQAFIDAGAIQCGFCTSGMIMSAYALLLKEHNPSRERIQKAIAGNLCRCTGYQQIIDAIELAAQRMFSREESAAV